MTLDDDTSPAAALAKGRERLLRDIKLTESAVNEARRQLAASEPELARLKSKLADYDAFVARTLPVAEVRP